jgi:hypothetical protein
MIHVSYVILSRPHSETDQERPRSVHCFEHVQIQATVNHFVDELSIALTTASHSMSAVLPANNSFNDFYCTPT